ncbi:unnamed protein product [Amoebophrya sp. A120]|nr:unnamed protein product [Amoebophrya sp. A120]|eukprot:GSA120T00005732001.1
MWNTAISPANSENGPEGDRCISFGKHKGKTFKAVYDTARQYAWWCVDQLRASRHDHSKPKDQAFQDFAKYAEKRRRVDEAQEKREEAQRKAEALRKLDADKKLRQQQQQHQGGNAPNGKEPAIGGGAPGAANNNGPANQVGAGGNGVQQAYSAADAIWGTSCKVMFGKHNGELYQDVYKTDKKYVTWVCGQLQQERKGKLFGRLDGNFRKFANYCEKKRQEEAIEKEAEKQAKAGQRKCGFCKQYGHTKANCPENPEAQEKKRQQERRQQEKKEQQRQRKRDQQGGYCSSDFGSDGEYCFDYRGRMVRKDEEDSELVKAAKRGDLAAVKRAVGGAAAKGKVEKSRFLNYARRWTEVGDYSNKEWEWFGDTAILGAVRSGHADVVYYLLREGADPCFSSCVRDDEYETVAECIKKKLNIGTGSSAPSAAASSSSSTRGQTQPGYQKIRALLNAVGSFWADSDLLEKQAVRNYGAHYHAAGHCATAPKDMSGMIKALDAAYGVSPAVNTASPGSASDEMPVMLAAKRQKVA